MAHVAALSCDMVPSALAATAAAPWWGVPVVAGAFLLLGGLLAAVYGRRNESKKLATDQRLRFDVEVVDLVVEVLTFSDKWFTQYLKLTVSQRAEACRDFA